MRAFYKLFTVILCFHLVKLDDDEDFCVGFRENNITNALRQLEGKWTGGGVFNLDRPIFTFLNNPNVYIPWNFQPFLPI